MATEVVGTAPSDKTKAKRGKALGLHRHFTKKGKRNMKVPFPFHLPGAIMPSLVALPVFALIQGPTN